ncbi:putative Dihydroorotase [uncultured delta proteobacterium]|uniref:Putative Dihydroorotase n=1 Tax=uncultured delta proteobacterium TaxID=34034 RepID=A0A212KBH7_9DELT|nr:putative Dihydroorotase [uncultured delta proteobacterium]
MIRIINGRILDPARGIDTVGDICIAGSTIVSPEAMGPGACETIDASGKLVTPGLVDFHLHAYNTGSALGIPLDPVCAASGVTTAVDAGTSGHITAAAFRGALSGTVTRLKALLSCSPEGLLSLRFHERSDPALFDKAAMKEVVTAFPDLFIGVKIRVSADVADAFGLAGLEAAVSIAEDLGLPLVVHTTNPPASADAIASMLRPGDVFTHAFHGTGHTILKDGRVRGAVRKARERGVLFDDCHGRAHFAFSTLDAALADGFFPDMISSDIIAPSAFRQPLGGLPMVLSRYLASGADLPEILTACVVNPAKFLGLEKDIASLAPGTCADVAVFSPLAKRTVFRDAFGKERVGETVLVPEVTIRQGTIVYRSYGSY